MTELSKRYTFSNLPAEIQSSHGSDLYKAIFQSSNPERVVRALPPQSVYLALQGFGLESAVGLIEILPEHHYRISLDLHLWVKDEISEDAFWQWLEVVDQDDTLEPLQRLVHVIDPKLLAVLFGRYVHSIIGDEKTDLPPAEGYYTPDGGYTWIEIQLEEPRRLRLFARLLAMLYETNSQLFYQILNEASAASITELEEESFQDKTRRLADEGLPDMDTSSRLQTPLNKEQFRALLGNEKRERSAGEPSLTALVRSGVRLEPLTSLLESAIAEPEAPDAERSLRAEVEAELSLIVNSALLCYVGGMSDFPKVEYQVRQARGILNIGLERGCEISKLTPLDLLKRFGLQPIYRLGLGELRDLRKHVRDCLLQHGSTKGEALEDPMLKKLGTGVVDGDCPRLPEEFDNPSSSSGSEGEETVYRPFETLRQITAVKEVFRQNLSH